MTFGTEIAGRVVKRTHVCARIWGGANGLAGEFAGVKGSYLTALMLFILESFSARWIGLLRVTLNSTNDALERRTSTRRWVITPKCSVGWLDEETWKMSQGTCRDGFVNNKVPRMHDHFGMEKSSWQHDIIVTVSTSGD